MENVDMVVKAPKNPDNTKTFSVPSSPNRNRRNDATVHPTMLTMNVAQGKSVSTAR